MFEEISSRVNLPELEEAILVFWRENDIFKRSVEQRRDAKRFTLYEGPPTANGNPGIHHVISRCFKDVMPRYKAMKGYYTPRIGGWDTHGLPVELEVEKELGLKTKTEIENYGIAEFNARCRQSVFRYKKEWDKITERIAYWVDLDNAYITMDNNYIESVWWAIKEMWQAQRVYKGYKTAAHCPRCGTSLSSHEVALGYKENTIDPSVFIMFKATEFKQVALQKLAGEKDIYFLAWTTTPWTLAGNTALAVDAEADYVALELDDRLVIMAEPLLEAVDLDDKEIKLKFKGKDIVRAQYQPLYNPHQYGEKRYRFKGDGTTILEEQQPDKSLTYRVIATNFVSMGDGTGIVHVAPSFGEVDFDAGKGQGLDFVQNVDLTGMVTGDYPFSGKFVKAADALVIEELKSRGLLFRAETISHTYPFCWRCGTAVLYYVKESWYIKTTAVKDKLISGNEEVFWRPAHIKDGRFGNWLENNVDWAFSRERYWGTPLPIWECTSCDTKECIGGLEELKEKKDFSGFEEPLDLHRPYVDDLTYTCPDCGSQMKRVKEVIDCWFDSGAMIVAQWHYPFENQDIAKDGRFPADYICEAVDQTRGWFYSLHAISTLLFDQPCFKNVICLGHILDEKGEKMSKAKGNVVEPWQVINKHGADAVRWYLLTATPPGNARRFSEELVKEVSKQFLMKLWNVYSFFVTYANIDKYDPAIEMGKEVKPDELDRWITSELNQLVDEVEKEMEVYNPTDAGRKIEAFVDYLSNWYVRRSRRRFWKSEGDADKLAAYNTLYNCLITVAKLMAPLTPFIAEALYRNLVCSTDKQAPPSVHMANFPVADTSLIDEKLSVGTRLAMKLSSMGRAARSQAAIKVRQPLKEAIAVVKSSGEREQVENVAAQIIEELNIKELKIVTNGASIDEERYTVATEGGYAVAVLKELTPELAAEGLTREIVHRIQNMRRTADYDIANHIRTYYEVDEETEKVINEFSSYIERETLTQELVKGIPQEEDVFTQSFKLGGRELKLGVRRLP
jgi:isoleucyl-tRNA synthetase